ncbi:tetratricopeptide repeat protein 37-like [Patella vulgata]|uniref:tetratricopeptide repeat protein 37-like n=1 Tax=Patella vulgata TaxID=6465 RepID=UPI0024A99FCE|nr:tetratricopeptide repeat protein 37-like [Patella vulgata]
MKRLAGILNELGSTDKCIKVYQDLLDETEDDKNKLEIKQTMIKLLESQDVVQTKLLFDCYDSCLEGGQLTPDEKEAMLTGYVSIIVDKMPKDVIEVEINKLSQISRMAKKCYEKAYHLDCTLEEAGAAVCDIMTSIGEQDAAYDLLLKVTNEASAGSAKWAWLRLGLCQIKLDNAVAAISSFQSALRADTTDKIATITQTLGIYDEAVTTYKDILDISPNYVPALKGLGETNLLMARSHLNQNLDGRVKDNCEEALVFLTKAASERSDMSCLWKLLGDACILVLPLASDNFILSVPKKLLEKCDKNSDELVAIKKREVIQLSTRCYGRALKILPENSMLWHDLGIAYFHLSELVQEKVNNPELAQHCFIKSVNTETNNVVAWTNLGTLYLIHDNSEGSVGYAHWVCTRCNDDTTALNMYGLLLEQQTFYSSASTALESKQNLYEKSIEIYKQTTSIEQAEDICYYGYTLYKAGDLAESFKAYEKAAEIVEKDDDRSHVYAALGMVSYKFGDLDGAKTALFTGSQTSPPSIIGLKALCGLGLLQSDVTLVTAVLQELVKQEDNQHSDTMWFTVVLDLVQGNFIQPMRYLQRTIHTNPRLYETWLVLAELLVKYFPERGTASANCIRVGKYISQVNQEVSEVFMI